MGVGCNQISTACRILENSVYTGLQNCRLKRELFGFIRHGLIAGNECLEIERGGWPNMHGVIVQNQYTGGLPRSAFRDNTLSTRASHL